MTENSLSSKLDMFTHRYFPVAVIALTIPFTVCVVYFALSNGFTKPLSVESYPTLIANTFISAIFVIIASIHNVLLEKKRKHILQKQIVTSFQTLSEYFSTCTVLHPNLTDEQRINIKNMRVFSIENLISQLPIRLGDEMSREIPKVLNRALCVHIISKSDDPAKHNPSQCDQLMQSIDKIIVELEKE